MTKGTNLGVDKQTMPLRNPTILLRNPQGNFVQISNAIVRDARLSFKARGLLAFFLSHHKSWKVYLRDLVKFSLKDGKRSIQSGVKELRELGYISLNRLKEEKSNKFIGSFYLLNKEVEIPRESQNGTAKKMDDPILGQSLNRVDTKADNPKTGSCNKNIKFKKTNLKNTKKEKHQQQQKGNSASDVVDASFKFSFFFKNLIHKVDWKNLFIGEQITKDKTLTESDLELLIRHFEKTSLKSGKVYKNITEAKTHFSNWFNTNQEKGCLMRYIEAFISLNNQARKYLTKLLPQSENYFDKIHYRKCKTTDEVLELLVLLKKHKEIYSRKFPQLLCEKERKSIESMILDIEKLSIQVENRKANQELDWYCKKNETVKCPTPAPNQKPQLNQQLSNLKNNLTSHAK